MTQGEVIELFKSITMSYPAFRVPDELMKDQVLYWHEHLRDVPFETAMKNLREHIRTERFPPTIADIRRDRIEEKSTVPGPEETQRMVLAEFDRLKKQATPMPDYVREELKRLAKRA